MPQFIWVSESAVLAIHSRQIAEHGGTKGIRDIGLLSSALARPKNMFAYNEDANVSQLAAAYAFGVSANHPFLDGNKRTAYVVMRTFLLLNGFDLFASQKEKYLMFIELAKGNLSEDKLINWLLENSRRL